MKRLKITVDGQLYEVLVEEVDSQSGADAPPVQVESKAAATATPVAGGTVVPAPLSSTVVDLHIAVGQTVTAGQNVVTVEAMKMNSIVTAPIAGMIATINVAKGDHLEEGQTILTIS